MKEIDPSIKRYKNKDIESSERERKLCIEGIFHFPML